MLIEELGTTIESALWEDRRFTGFGKPSVGLRFWMAQRFSAAVIALFLNAASQAAEKVDVAGGFGWRSGSPLR
jgi:hypothetical protein